jgi:hypothetical protein
MLLTNQWLDKLATSHADFKAHGMLTALLNLFRAYFSLQFGSSTDRVFWLSTDEGTDVAPPAPAAGEDDNNDDEIAVAGPKIQAHVNIAKMITRMYLFLIYFITVK